MYHNTMSEIIRARSWAKRFGELVAGAGRDRSVAAGECLGLLGPTGAGKTTAMKMLLGLGKPTSGRASLFGTDVMATDFTHALRRTGALIEAPAMYERLSARKNLELQALALGIEIDATRIDELLELVDLADRAKDKAGGYSLGMKQRLGIAIGLIGSPELVSSTSQRTASTLPESSRSVSCSAAFRPWAQPCSCHRTNSPKSNRLVTAWSCWPKDGSSPRGRPKRSFAATRRMRSTSESNRARCRWLPSACPDSLLPSSMRWQDLSPSTCQKDGTAGPSTTRSLPRTSSPSNSHPRKSASKRRA